MEARIGLPLVCGALLVVAYAAPLRADDDLAPAHVIVAQTEPTEMDELEGGPVGGAPVNGGAFEDPAIGGPPPAEGVPEGGPINPEALMGGMIQDPAIGGPPPAEGVPEGGALEDEPVEDGSEIAP